MKPDQSKKTSQLKSATNATRSTQATKKSWIQKAELKDSKKDTNKSNRHPELFAGFPAKAGHDFTTFKKEDFNFKALFFYFNLNNSLKLTTPKVIL